MEAVVARLVRLPSDAGSYEMVEEDFAFHGLRLHYVANDFVADCDAAQRIGAERVHLVNRDQSL